MVKQTIGELNGLWALMFKAVCAVTPLIVALQVWLVTNTFTFRAFMTQGDRFTARDGTALELQFTKDLNALRTQLNDTIKMHRDERQIQMQQLDDKMTKKLDGIADGIRNVQIDIQAHLRSANSWNPAFTNRYTIP